MGHFIIGVLTGILICGVVMLVRCAAWYEHKHPEDDYWHRRVLPYAHEKQNALLKAAKDMACSDTSEEVFNGKENKFLERMRTCLDDGMVKDILSTGRTYVRNLYSVKRDKFFSAYLCMEWKDGKSRFRLDFTE